MDTKDKLFLDMQVYTGTPADSVPEKNQVKLVVLEMIGELKDII